MAMPAWVAEVGVLGTWVIGVSAIWGEKIRSALFKPRLAVALLSDSGEPIPITPQNEGDPPKQSRWYHLRVSNTRRFPAAHGVQVVITKVDKEGPGGRPVTEFAAMLPLGWRHPQIHPTELTVGPERHSDFFYVTEDPALIFVPMIAANNFRRVHTSRTKLWVTLLARAIECDSEPVTFEIAWDGDWSAGEAEMKKHLVISVTKA